MLTPASLRQTTVPNLGVPGDERTDRGRLFLEADVDVGPDAVEDDERLDKDVAERGAGVEWEMLLARG